MLPCFSANENKLKDTSNAVKTIVTIPIVITDIAWKWLEDLNKQAKKQNKQLTKKSINRSSISSRGTEVETRKLTVVATAYSAPCKYQGTSMHTATGRNVRNSNGKPIRGIAVDPRVIKLGSYVRVKAWSNEWYIADDTGGAIKGNRIDLRMDRRSDCLTWGRRSVCIEIRGTNKNGKHGKSAASSSSDKQEKAKAKSK